MTPSTALYAVAAGLFVLAIHELVIGKKSMEQMIEQGMMSEIVTSIGFFLVAGLI